MVKSCAEIVVWLTHVYIFCFILFNSTNGDFNVRPQRIYNVREGQVATFVWDYVPPSGLSVLINSWCKINPTTNQCPVIPIMVKLPTDSQPVVRSDNVEYFSRTSSRPKYTMVIRDIRLSDDGIYEMSVTFSNGNRISDRVTLVVLVNPQITKRTLQSKITIREGQKTTLDCGVSIGNPKPFTIEWWFNNVIILTKLSNFELPLVFNSTSRSQRGQYKCLAKNLAGSTSYTIDLNVVFAPENVRIIPSSSGVVSVQEGGNVSLNCLADGFPSPSFDWTRIRQLYREKLVENSVISKLVLKRIDKSQADNYECAAVNIYGRKALNVYLDVQYSPEGLNFSINNQNTSVVYVNKGMSVNMTCTSRSNPQANYRIGFQSSAIAKSTTNMYFITSAIETDDGVYECIATNGIGKPASYSIQLIIVVAPREITVRGTPSSNKLNENQYVTLRCEMKGHPPPMIYWTLNRQILTFDNRRKMINGSIPNIGQDTRYFSEIRFSNLHRFDDGEYTCFGSNWGGVIEKKYLLDVQYAPYIIVWPKNQTIREYQPAALSCRAVGKPPLSAYLWTQNGIVRTEAGETITFNRATRRDGGKYTCAGINPVGVGIPAVAFLIVTYKPQFTVTPQLSQIVNTSVNIRLSCNATGVPKPKILWSKDGDPKIIHTGEILILNNIGYKQKGTYYCKASNEIGNVTARSILLVNHIPVITTSDPASTKLGSDVGVNAPPVKIVCAVDSYPAAVITWSRGSSGILSSTAGYEIDDTSKSGTSVLTVIMSDISKRGKYTCTAKNKLGTVQQVYEIFEKSKPDPPVKDSLKATDTLQLTDPATVEVEIRWTPGYNGGYAVTFYLYYREKGSRNYQQRDLGAIAYNVYRIRGLKTTTTYEFTMRAVNEKGPSYLYDPPLTFTTRDAPPKRGGASSRRYGTLGTQVQVTWSINDYSLAKMILIRYKRVIDTPWNTVTVPYEKLNSSSYIINSLDSERMYEFQVFIVYKDNDKGWPITAGKVVPGGPGTVSPRTGLSKQDIIAIVVGVGGFLLIIIVVCTLVLLRRKKTRKRNDGNFEMKTNSGGRGNTRGGVVGYSTVGSDVVRTGLPNDHAADDYDDDDALVTDALNNEKSRKESPPSYNDHFSYYDGTDVNATTFQTRPPVTNTPAYSSFSALTNQKRAAALDAEPVTKSDSRTSLVSGRAAEISRKNKTPFDFDYDRDERGNRYRDVDRNGYDDEKEPERERPRYAARDKYKYRPDPIEQKPRAGLGSSSGDDDLPSPPPFMREALNNVNSDSERVPGSMGERMGKNKNNTLRSSPQHSPSSQRSGVSSNQYRSDTEYIEDDGDTYVGYLV